MSYRGHIENGVVVLDEEAPLPEGAHVRVDLLSPPEVSEKAMSDYERLQSVIGKAEGLPSDLARNHDHYLHGQPKK